MSTEVEDVIRKGPAAPSDGGVGLDIFLQAMQRLLKAQFYFKKHNPQSVELENVITLFSQGGDGLNKEFKDLLFRHSKPMLPVSLLNIINLEDGNT